MQIDRHVVRFVTLTFLLFMSFQLEALTLHMQMTPGLAGTNSVLMKPAGAGRTRFVIPYSTKEKVAGDSRFPVVRGGQLEIYGEKGLLLRCPVKPRQRPDGTLVFSFELQNDIAKRSKFTLSVFRDDGQVGGGRVYSYQLIDFIDPSHSQREMTQRIEDAHKRMLRNLRNISIDSSPR